MVDNYHPTVFRKWHQLIAIATILVMMFSGPASSMVNIVSAGADSSPTLATTNTMTLQVQGTDGSSIGTYKYLINIDN